MTKSILLVISFFLFQFGAIFAQTVDFKKNFGAKGDGRTDDSKAWYNALQYLNKNKGGTLVVPAGTYRIGKQVKNGNGISVSAFRNLLTATGAVKIVGAVDASGRPASRFKFLDGLFHGKFKNQNVNGGIGLELASVCNNVELRNLEFDGNISKMQLGGPTQNAHVGVYNNGRGLKMYNVYTHHFALDGIYIVTGVSNNSKNIYLENVLSEYNSRQGISFTGGSGLYVKNSTFRYTSMNGHKVSPGANVDIEMDYTIPIRNIYFENCKIYDNSSGSGSINLAGDVDNITFQSCEIKNTKSPIAVQFNFTPNKNFIFKNCTITGSLESTLNAVRKKTTGQTVFDNCKIYDNRLRVPNQSLINVLDGVAFNNCSFYIWNKGSFIKSQNNGAERKTNAVQISRSNFYDLDTKSQIDPVKKIVTANRVVIR